VRGMRERKKREGCTEEAERKKGETEGKLDRE
jgi:hypothetical protein